MSHKGTKSIASQGFLKTTKGIINSTIDWFKIIIRLCVESTIVALAVAVNHYGFEEMNLYSLGGRMTKASLDANMSADRVLVNTVITHVLVGVLFAVTTLIQWSIYRIIITIGQASCVWLFVVFTAPFRTGIALTAPEHFHGTYQEIVTPQGAYARAKVRKNDKVIEYLLKPASSATINPVNELMAVETFRVEDEEVAVVGEEAQAILSDKEIENVKFDKPKEDKKEKKTKKSEKATQESAIDKIVTSNVPENVYQLDIYLFDGTDWILNGKAAIIRGRRNKSDFYTYLLQTSWHVVVDAIELKSPIKIVNPQNGKFCYKHRLDQWVVRNEVMDYAWCRVKDQDISKLGARAYDACLDFSYENTKISIGQAAVKGVSNYNFVRESLVPMAINYEISTLASDSGSALFILGKPIVIGIHNWGLNNNTYNRGVCLIGEYRRFFLGSVESQKIQFDENQTYKDCKEVSIPESDMGFSRKMKYLEREAMEDWERENRDSDFYTQNEIANYDKIGRASCRERVSSPV